MREVIVLVKFRVNTPPDILHSGEPLQKFWSEWYRSVPILLFHYLFCRSSVAVSIRMKRKMPRGTILWSEAMSIHHYNRALIACSSQDTKSINPRSMSKTKTRDPNKALVACKKRNCQTCPIMNHSGRIVSHITGRTYHAPIGANCHAE